MARGGVVVLCLRDWEDADGDDRAWDWDWNWNWEGFGDIAISLLVRANGERCVCSWMTGANRESVDFQASVAVAVCIWRSESQNDSLTRFRWRESGFLPREGPPRQMHILPFDGTLA